MLVVFVALLGVWLLSHPAGATLQGRLLSDSADELQLRIKHLEQEIAMLRSECVCPSTKTNRVVEKKPHKTDNFINAANIMGLDTSIISYQQHRHSSGKKKKHEDLPSSSVPLQYSATNQTVGPKVEVKAESKDLNIEIKQVQPPQTVQQHAPESSSQVDNKKADAHVPVATASSPVVKDEVQKNLDTIVSDILSRYESPYSNSLFYMYELEEDFWWRWPVPGTDCSGNGYVGHEHAVLSGMGTPIIPEDGLYLTWHFSLFSSLFNRLKRSRRRTYNPDQASLFIIPYDLGLDGYLNANTCQNSRQCTRGLPQRLQDHLVGSKYWQRHKGLDHAVLWSLGQYHPWPRNGCDLFMRDFCALCTFTCYWMDSTKPESRFISVPFPSAYHWSDSIRNVPWDIKLAPGRNMTAVYLGSTQTLNPAHTKIRRAMTAQCNASTDCHWLQIGHTSKDNNIGFFLSIYKKAVFCLCPPGDDPARKAVFDSILSGCIPVIFQKETLYNQYPWHLGEQAALDISVSIPGASVRSGKLDFMTVLRSISPEVIRQKQEALMRLAPRVQYAIPPEDMLADPSDATPWEPAFPDAADITLDGMFERVSHLLHNESTNIPTPFMLQKAWHQQYDAVIVKVPNYRGNGSLGSDNDQQRGDHHRGKGRGEGREHRLRKKIGN